MITCDIIGYSSENGGLGNQMFVIAATLALAKRNNDEAAFPDLLNPQYEYYGNTIFHKLEKIFDKRLVTSSHIEKQYTSTIFEEIFYKKNMCLKGHFCSYKYFEDQIDYIKSSFQLPKTISEEIDNNYLHINFNNSLSLHVRRGDYLKFSDNHTNLKIDYYENALAFFPEIEDIYVFSDDIEWCKNNLYFKNKKLYFLETKKDITDLYLMSKFKNIIIANSTFSWWAAFLGEKKRVVAPIEWFGKKRVKNNLLETKDLIPQDWIRI